MMYDFHRQEAALLLPFPSPSSISALILDRRPIVSDSDSNFSSPRPQIADSKTVEVDDDSASFLESRIVYGEPKVNEFNTSNTDSKQSTALELHEVSGRRKNGSGVSSSKSQRCDES